MTWNPDGSWTPTEDDPIIRSLIRPPPPPMYEEGQIVLLDGEPFRVESVRPSRAGRMSMHLVREPEPDRCPTCGTDGRLVPPSADYRARLCTDAWHTAQR